MTAPVGSLAAVRELFLYRKSVISVRADALTIPAAPFELRFFCSLPVVGSGGRDCQRALFSLLRRNAIPPAMAVAPLSHSARDYVRAFDLTCIALWRDGRLGVCR